VPAWTPPTGEGIRRGTAFKWEVRGTNSVDVGLGDYHADWTKSEVSSFTARNTTEDMVSRGLILYAYNETTGCSASKNMNIAVYPTITLAPANNANLAKLCAGVRYENNIIVTGRVERGRWDVLIPGTDAPGGIGTSVSELSRNPLTRTFRGLALDAGNTPSKREEEVLYTSEEGCVSNRLQIAIYPKPTMNVIPDASYCPGSNVLPFTPVSIGTDEARPTHYKWSGGSQAGLEDHLTTWDRTQVSGFLSLEDSGGEQGKRYRAQRSFRM